MLDLEPIKARVQAAIDGPWESVELISHESVPHGDWYTWVVIPKGKGLGKEDRIAEIVEEAQRIDGVLVFNTEQYRANADFIAQARQDIPNLIAEIEHLRAANTTLRALVEDAFDRDHAPGCAGGYADVYPCKCGFRQWKVDAAKALGMKRMVIKQ